MASTVDTLIVEIKAETAKLRKGLDQVNQKLDKTNQKAKSSTSAFKSLVQPSNYRMYHQLSQHYLMQVLRLQAIH